jgi:glycogen debranching enzyme
MDGGLMLRSVVARCARLQGTIVDPQRDEEPGRIINQAKLDALSRLGDQQFRRYYADVASPFMFIIALGYGYVRTGDRELVERHWQAARRVLDWAREYGDRDGDGYIEYLTQSKHGPTHQGWKDSENAVVDAEGRQVKPPIAACEIQGYYHVALQFMAALAALHGELGDARKWWQQAADLKERFNRDFWMDDEGYVAFGLDPDKRQIRALTSNAGQCLPTGIISDEHIPRLVRRMFEPDLFSGWGVRTLSTHNAAYNPLDYHLGAVWPVENGSILFGLRRYGINDRTEQLARALYDLARLWPGGRAPETVGGYARTQSAHPGTYPRANIPQAWNQSVVPLIIQCLLGLVPFAPMHLLLVDPILPEWLPEISIKRFRLGDATVSLHFQRGADGESHFEITEQEGTIRVVRQSWIESFSTDRWARLGDLVETIRMR